MHRAVALALLALACAAIPAVIITLDSEARLGTLKSSDRLPVDTTVEELTPVMVASTVGIGSQYAITAVNSHGKDLDGSKSYKLRLPPDVPAKLFWSLLVYDTQTRSVLQTDHRFSSVINVAPGVEKNADGSIDIQFGPKPPAGGGKNWVQTAPGKSWFASLRLYGPLEPSLDKAWRPSEIEVIE